MLQFIETVDSVFQRQRLIRESGQRGSPVKTFGSGGFENGGSVERPLQDGERIDIDGAVKTDNLQPEEEEDRDEIFRPLHVPGYPKPPASHCGSNRSKCYFVSLFLTL